MKVNEALNLTDLAPQFDRFWEVSAQKLRLIRHEYDTTQGSPVFTVDGRYTTRGWTEWTQGFQFGSELLQFDATGDQEFLQAGKTATDTLMAPHLTHTGVHDHGFNNVSTYGTLWRLAVEKRLDISDRELAFYELALKVSGAVQASRWTHSPDGGFIHSFNGPHSLFVDTIRTVRSLALSYRLGHTLFAENDTQISLLKRLIEHATATARYNIYYGEGRDRYDSRGRTAHEAVFNTTDGYFRCPGSQQGYSPFTTWTRGLAWAMLGFAEQLEFLATVPDEELSHFGGRDDVMSVMLKAATATSDFYIENSSLDGIPVWDTGAPDLHKLGNYRYMHADPYNDHEPFDSSAAAIAAQGLVRLGRYLLGKEGVTPHIDGDGSPSKRDATGKKKSGQAYPAAVQQGQRYWQAGLSVTNTLLKEPYLSRSEKHQGLLLHSVYHRPNGWDHEPKGSRIPCGESSMWGDYHMRELILCLMRQAEDKPYYTFFGGSYL